MKSPVFYYKVKALEKKGIKIKHETVDEFLARGGEIKVLPPSGFQFEMWEELQRQRWCKKNQARRGNGTRQIQESLSRIEEVILC